MALTTSKTIYRERFGPLIPGVFVLPFPYAAQLPAAIRDRPGTHFVAHFVLVYCLLIFVLRNAKFHFILHLTTRLSRFFLCRGYDCLLPRVAAFDAETADDCC